MLAHIQQTLGLSRVCVSFVNYLAVHCSLCVATLLLRCGSSDVISLCGSQNFVCIAKWVNGYPA